MASLPLDRTMPGQSAALTAPTRRRTLSSTGTGRVVSLGAPHIGNNDILLGIGASSAGNVWAVGYSVSAATTLHWDGAGWSVVPCVSPGTRAVLQRVARIIGYKRVGGRLLSHREWRGSLPD